MITTTIHDALDPLTGDRVSLRFDRTGILEVAGSLAGDRGRNIPGEDLWVLPGLYDGDAAFPLAAAGLRQVDVAACMSGGVAVVNVSVYCRDLERVGLAELLEELDRVQLPHVVPIVAVHPEEDYVASQRWLRDNNELIKERLPHVCKLFSYGDHFWDILDTAFSLDLLPIVYCREDRDIESIVTRAPGPIHFRHAVRPEQIDSMRKLPGATVQTSVHYLVPIERSVQERLHVLPRMISDVERETLAARVMSDVDIIVSDHNAQPLRPSPGPGLRVIQHFLPAVLTATDVYGWDLGLALTKVTDAPAERFGRSSSDVRLIVDPSYVVSATWPGQTDDRSPFGGHRLRGSVFAMASARAATMI